MIRSVARALFGACMLLYSVAHSDTVVSSAAGLWLSPSTWNGGNVPRESDIIIVNHNVVVDAGSAIAVSSLEVNGHLTLSSGAVLQLRGVTPDAVVLMVSGILESADGSAFDGTTAANTIFGDGSRYIHRQGPLGFIPMASWHINSTLQISGFVNDGYINLAHAASWRQTFGNVEYDCPGQTVFIVDLNGHLRDIRGNFTIKSTNNKALRLSTTQVVTINVGGDFSIDGASQVWFSTNSSDCVITIAGNLACRSTATASCYLATRGKIAIRVGQDWTIDSNSPLRMASSSTDSTGTRQARVSVGGNVALIRGGLIAPPPGSGSGSIEFNGSLPQRVTVSAPMTGNLEYAVAAGATVVLGTSVLSSDRGSLEVRGRLEAGSADAGGALQTGGGGNIRVPGPWTFAVGSHVVYNGATHQYIGNGHPPNAHTSLDNVDGTTLLNDVVMKGNLNISAGTLEQRNHLLVVEGDVTLPASSLTLDHVVLQGPHAQRIDGRSASMSKLEVRKSAGSVTLMSPLWLTGALDMATPGIGFHSNGNLTLVSTGDGPGQTASIGAIASASYIDGVVNTQRFISAEGRMYRYLSSPVAGVTVADLMDDFPVTGEFSDPSNGPGIRSDSPSLFEYDESRGAMMDGWQPYPAGGMAAGAPLQTGRGYAAFVRNQSPVIVDLQGVLNQGEIQIPLSYTSHSGIGNGWHLLGNPYPAAIDWDASALSKQLVSSVVAIRDNAARKFRYWDGDNMFSDIPDGKIAQGQSFWVRAMSSGASFTFREEAKTSDAAFYRRAVVSVPALKIAVSDGNNSDQMIVRLRRGSSHDVDRWDGVKLSNDILNLGTITDDGTTLAIDCRPSLPDSLAMRLTAPYKARFSLVLEAHDSLKQVYVYLKDRFLKTDTRIGMHDTVRFEVTDDSLSYAPDRFILRFDKQRRYPLPPHEVRHAPAADNTTSHRFFTYYPNPVQQDLIIEGEWLSRWNELNPASVAIYSISGVQVNADLYSVSKDPVCSGTAGLATLNCARLVVNVGQLSPGTYLVRLSDGQHTKWLRFLKT